MASSDWQDEHEEFRRRWPKIQVEVTEYRLIHRVGLLRRHGHGDLFCFVEMDGAYGPGIGEYQVSNTAYFEIDDPSPGLRASGSSARCRHSNVPPMLNYMAPR